MIPKLAGLDPDDAFSTVPYEKGFALLYQLETLVGVDSELIISINSRVTLILCAGMKRYLRAHVEKFKYGIFDSLQWKQFFLEHFKKEVSSSLHNSMRK